MNNILAPIIRKCNERGLSVDSRAVERFEMYHKILVEENEKYNLTAITQKEEVALKHFADCMLFATHINLSGGMRVCDVGSGAGFPGMVLKIICPDIELTLIDGLNKRVQFLGYLANSLGLSVNAIHARAEESGQSKELREQFNVVTARAVANMSVLSELCLPLVKQNGIFAAMKGPAALQEIEACKGIELLGGGTPQIITEEIENIGTRCTVICKKISQTPTKYPRSFAKISKQPL